MVREWDERWRQWVKAMICLSDHAQVSPEMRPTESSQSAIRNWVLDLAKLVGTLGRIVGVPASELSTAVQGVTRDGPGQMDKETRH